jgi:hypothetical protein
MIPHARRASLLVALFLLTSAATADAAAGKVVRVRNTCLPDTVDWRGPKTR